MKIIRRRYVDEYGHLNIGKFICEGQWSNGKYAYSLIAKMVFEDGKFSFQTVSNEERIEDHCMYIQYRDNDGMIMEHI